MSNLTSDLATPPVSGGTPRDESGEDSEGGRYVQAVRDRPVTLADARKWVESSGDDPEDYTISIRSIAYGQGLFSNRMSAVPKRRSKVVDSVDPHELLERLRPHRVAYKRSKARNSSLVAAFGDWQYGKKTPQGSTADTISTVLRGVQELAATQVDDRHEELLLIFGGDLIEGCTIYPNMAHYLEMSRKQQVEGCVSLVLEILDTLAPLFDRVKVLGVRGNHGENRVGGNRTTLDDNDDTHVLEMAKLALERDPQRQNIEWVIAGEEAAMSIEVQGWRYGATHGDVFGKGVQGTSIMQKAKNWYKNMAAGRDAQMFGVDVCCTFHFHHEQYADFGAWEWRQMPAQDAAMSEYFRQTTGEYSEPGVLSWVVTPELRFGQPRTLARV